MIRSWFWLHLVGWLAVLLQPSIPAQYFGRYSRTALVMLVALTVTLPLVGGVSAWVGRRLAAWRLSVGAALAVFGAVAAALFVLWALPGATAPSYVVLRLYISAVMLTLGVWSLEALPTVRLRWGAVVATMVLLACAGLWLLALGFPGVRWIDEAYMVSVSHNFAQTGKLQPLIYDRVDTESYSLFYMGLGMWLRVWGTGLWTARAFVFGVGLLMLAISGWTAARLYGRFAAWGAVLLAAVSLLPLNLLRQDVSVSLYLSVALALYVLATQGERHWLHVGVGFFVAFATDGHPNAYRFSFAFGAAYALEWALLLWQERRWYPPIFLLALGGIIGLSVYITLYATLTEDFLKLAASPILGATEPFYRVIFTQMVENVRNVPLLFGAALVGLIIGLRAPTPITRLLAVVLAVNVVLMAALNGYYRTYYIAQNISSYVLLAAGLLYALRPNVRDIDGVQAGVIALLLMAGAGFTFSRWNQPELRHGFNDALHIAAEVDTLLPDSARVVGSDPMYFRLLDKAEFVEYATAGWVRNKFDIPEPDLWTQVNADAVILLYNNPERPPQSLLDYVQAADYQRVACWQSARVGQVDLFTREPISLDGVSGLVACKEISP